MSQHQRAIIALLAVLACTNLGVLFGVTRDDALERQWQVALGAIDEALLLGDKTSAVARWREAYGLAVKGGGWPQLVDVGDAALRIGDAPALQPSAAAAAPHGYLIATHRGRPGPPPQAGGGSGAVMSAASRQEPAASRTQTRA